MEVLPFVSFKCVALSSLSPCPSKVNGIRSLKEPVLHGICSYSLILNNGAINFHPRCLGSSTVFIISVIKTELFLFINPFIIQIFLSEQFYLTAKCFYLVGSLHKLNWESSIIFLLFIFFSFLKE